MFSRPASVYAICFTAAFVLRAGFAQLQSSSGPPAAGLPPAGQNHLQVAGLAAPLPLSQKEEPLKEAGRRVRLLASMGFNWTPAAMEEARFCLRDLTAAQVAELLRPYDSEDPALDALFNVGMTELAEKDYVLARAELAGRPGSKHNRLETFVLKGLAKADPQRALLEAGNLPPARREASLKACYAGWREADAPAAWGHLMASENPDQALVALVASGMAALKPETVGDYLSKLTSGGAVLPEGMLEQCLHAASRDGTELTGRLLRSLPESLRAEALQALANTGCARGLPALLKEIGGLRPGEKQSITTAWASSHQTMALKMVQAGAEDALSLLTGIISRPHFDGAGQEAWALVPEAHKAELAAPMARNLAVLSVSDAVGWSGSLSPELKIQATAEIVKWGFGRDDDAVFAALAALPAGAEKSAGVAALSEVWGKTEPNNAANWLLRQANPDDINTGLTHVLPEWAARDAAGLAEWVAGAQLSPETMEKVVEPLGQTNARFAEAVKTRREAHDAVH